MAGNYVQLFVFLGIGVGYISTYIFRVANKARAGALHSVTEMLFLRCEGPGSGQDCFMQVVDPEDLQEACLNDELQACPWMLLCCSREPERLSSGRRAQDMTYVKQLKDYENAVMAKRLEEMPETEKERLAAEVAAERAATDERKRRALEKQS